MNRMTTFGEVQEIVRKKALNLYDELIPVKEIEFDNLKSVNLSGKTYKMRTSAQRLFSNRLCIPFTYLEKCDADLQAENLNYWLEQERNDSLLIRFEGNEVRAVFTTRYIRFDNSQIMSRLYDYGIPMDTPVEFQMDNDLMMLNIPDEKSRFQLPGKDVFHPGFSIVNSEVGISALQISIYVMRLVCTNGLISQVAEGSNFRHVSTRILEEFPNILNRTAAEIGKQKRRWEISQESIVNDPESTIRTFNNQFQLSEIEKESVFWGYHHEPGNRMFDVINSYTKGSQMNGLSTDSAFTLQKVGGNILELCVN